MRDELTGVRRARGVEDRGEIDDLALRCQTLLDRQTGSGTVQRERGPADTAVVRPLDQGWRGRIADIDRQITTGGRDALRADIDNIIGDEDLIAAVR